jgi:serine/threonine protein kinase
MVMGCMKDGFVRGELLDGRFRTIAPLNHGSFGMVFLAEDTTTREEVAIKCLTKPDVAANTPYASNADEGQWELKCHGILKHHPHLVNLIHHFETTAHTYLVLEYCSQGDLYEAIRLGKGPLQTEHVRRFMLQLIDAVDHMHVSGLYHRDIKPENIFLTQDGSMKLGDFGLATLSLWSHEACVGSDRYMAPEQYDPAGHGYCPAKADIWSIGICLLNVLFARNPFVTPTESDILFADYRRDRQSLFDIFPNMSQDAFEILSNAMSVDPEKRDLAVVRQAIQRAVSFTTDDDSFDEFCIEERDIVRASANREPLRTPSILSPQMDSDDSFPWSRALNTTSPRKSRQLSNIPDSDSYEEDLFTASEKGLNLGESWYSGHANTPSISSALESNLSASFKSMAIHRPTKRPQPTKFPSSLPTHPSRPTMSMIFGKKDTVAKSWSEMFEEDEEESQLDAAIKNRREQNSRTWSQESKEHTPVPAGVLTESKSHSSVNVRRSPAPPGKTYSPIKTSHSPNENEPFSWRRPAQRSPVKPVSSDKWAALGNKRRSVQPESQKPAISIKKISMTTGSRKKPSTFGSSGFDYSGLPRRDSREKDNRTRPVWMDQDWRQHLKPVVSDEEDHEWVGGDVFTFHL